MNDRPTRTAERTGNLLLDALDVDERAVLLADARTRPIQVGTTLFHPGDAIGYVAFPTSGTLSMLAQPDHAMPVEAATIGREGAASLHSALGSRTATQELVGQVDGEMITVGIERFAKQAQEGQLQTLVYGYLEALVVQISLSAACNAVHHLNQRCARWLLQTHDRVDSDTFGLTQEYLGVMLGVQRPSVSIAQQTLQAAGCITYKRGSITIVDREALEAAACPCYEMIRREYSRLVPLHIQR
jgi:CRP-like cAMP-binding protein